MLAMKIFRIVPNLSLSPTRHCSLQILGLSEANIRPLFFFPFFIRKTDLELTLN